MSREFPQLDQVRLVVDEAVKERHLGVIADQVRARRTPRFRKFRLLAVATALLLLLPVIAVAADEAVPGDVLYPVKRLFEPAVSLFDRDVEVDHRVEEVEILHERDVDEQLVREQIDRARDVVTDLHPGHAERLRRVVDQLEEPDADRDDHHSSDEGRIRVKADQDTQEEPSDSILNSDDEVRQPDETTTTHASDRTTSPGDRHRDG